MVTLDAHLPATPTGRIVVTGGAGVLGGAFSRRLAERGGEVTAVDVNVWADAPAGLDHRVADIRDLDALRGLLPGAAAVVHCAGALPSYPAEQIRSIVVEGTRTVLEAAYRAGVPRVVYISSTALYGLPEICPTPEEYGPHPIDVYGESKAAAEEVCASYREKGLCIPVLRPKTFLGPGRMGLFAMLFEWAEEGRNFPVLGRGDARIQMFDIEDLLDAVDAALSAPAELANDAFNVAAADFGTLRESFQYVLDAAGRGGRVVSIPARPALVLLGGLERLKLSPVYGRLRHKLLADSFVSIERARERLGWAPRYSNREAILRTFAWWRASRTDAAVASRTGRTSRDAWRQGALRSAKVFF